MVYFFKQFSRKRYRSKKNKRGGMEQEKEKEKEKERAIFVSAQGDQFQIEIEKLKPSIVWENMTDVLKEDSTPVPCPSINTPTLAKIMEFLTLYSNEPMSELIGVNPLDRVQQEYKDFAKMASKGEEDNIVLIFDVLMAANTINIPSLINLMCAKIAAIFLDSPDIKSLATKFNCPSIHELNEAEKEQVYRANSWLKSDVMAGGSKFKQYTKKQRQTTKKQKQKTKTNN
jgi:hypothetical protein